MLTHVSLFSGIGGIDLAAEWAGFTTLAFCERDAYAKRVLGKHWPGVPICEDIHELTADWLGEHTGHRAVTLVSGGPPCQPVSLAGKRRGKEDDRYLWPAALAVVEDIRPAWVCFENPPGFLSMGLDEVLAELESQGYETGTVMVPACGVGAWHRRQRLFILANAERAGSQERLLRGMGGMGNHGQDDSMSIEESSADEDDVSNPNGLDGQRGTDEAEGKRRHQPAQPVTDRCRADVSNADGTRWEKRKGKTNSPILRTQQHRREEYEGRWQTEPDVGRVANGIPRALDISGVMQYIETYGKTREVEMAQEAATQGEDGKVRVLRIYLQVATASRRLGEAGNGTDSMSDLSHEKRSSEGCLGSGKPKETSLRDLQDILHAEVLPCPQNMRSSLPIDIGQVQRWLAVGKRVDRLRCLGNAVVPQQVYPILQAIADTLLTHAAGCSSLDA